jgi:hypothetical protein
MKKKMLKIAAIYHAVMGTVSGESSYEMLNVSTTCLAVL